MVDAMPEVLSGDPFRLKDLTLKVIDEKLTPEQLQVQVTSNAGNTRPMRGLIRFWCLTIATNTERYVALGKGMFRQATEQDFDETKAIDEAIDSEDDEELSEYSGSVYAFSFPSIVKPDQPFPIKVGKTTGSVEDRVASQCKGSATFENPVILKQWQVKRVGPTELAIHNVLKARGKWREHVPGVEWFDTTMNEIEAILKFVMSE